MRQSVKYMYTQMLRFFLLFILLPNIIRAQEKKAEPLQLVEAADSCYVYNIYSVDEGVFDWEGDCENGLATGHGSLIIRIKGKRCVVFVGDFKDGLPQGRGELFVKTSKRKQEIRYKGVFEKGKLEGVGETIKINANGKVFYSHKGEYKNNKPNGFGVVKYFISETSMVYEAEFINGELKGQVKYQKIIADQLVYEYIGGWLDDAPHGVGTETVGRNIYTGQFLKGKKSGKGKLFFGNTLVYEGEWSKNRFYGLGKKVLLNGAVYQGEFYEGGYHGLGLLLWQDGKCYLGEWENSCFNGLGYIITSDGIFQSGGIWSMGKLKTEHPIEDINRKIYSKYSDSIIRYCKSLTLNQR